MSPSPRRRPISSPATRTSWSTCSSAIARTARRAAFRWPRTGRKANGPATLWASLSANGRAVAFASSASNLVPNDTNGAQDVFVSSVDCGNGVVNPGEECDDGNVADGDCCSAECNLEAVGSACDDGDLCTQTDGCDGAGTCVGDDPVVCPGPGDSCRANGACDPRPAPVRSSMRPPGHRARTAISVTGSDACDGEGSCVGSDPVVCPEPSEACHVNGACDPTTGTCPILDAPAGTLCSDGNLCTGSDACDGAGSCVGSDPVVCPQPSEACHVNGACDPATGTCPILEAPDGTSCDDGEACTTGDACAAGACEPGELDPSACVDPTRCYRAELGFSDLLRFRIRQVTIADEFGTGRYWLQRPTELCATATVDDGDAATPPGDGAAMRQLLACHDIDAVWINWKPPVFDRHAATVENLLGAQRLSIGNPLEMCMRANERGSNPSALLDDYVCYGAKRADGEQDLPERTVLVEDRFGTASVRVGRPELYCNPASADGGMIAQPLANLVCYSTRDSSHSGGSTPLRPITLSIEDRFTSGKLFTFGADRLCLPTAVQEVTKQARALRFRHRHR
jgi:cysteine-rich repeat protein